MSRLRRSDRPWAALGVFDGVHLGHRAILDRARTLAAASAGTSTLAISFHPHPRAVVGGDPAVPAMICTLDDRVSLLRAAGADDVEVIEFSQEVRDSTPEQFVERWLAARFGVRGVVVGQNFRFGSAAAGDTSTLRELGRLHGIEVEVVGLQADGGQPVSSSRIRSLLAAGDVEEAALLLGRPHSLAGPVVAGARRGRELGMPTANVDVPEGVLVPADGVYAGTATEGTRRWTAAISIGTNPQFQSGSGDPRRSVEAHLLDYDDAGDLYGSTLRVHLRSRLRGQAVFDSVPKLVEQMNRDVEQVRTLATGWAG